MAPDINAIMDWFFDQVVVPVLCLGIILGIGTWACWPIIEGVLR